jgi:hypothetical protein
MRQKKRNILAEIAQLKLEQDKWFARLLRAIRKVQTSRDKV